MDPRLGTLTPDEKVRVVDTLYRGAKIAERLHKLARKTYGPEAETTIRLGQEWLAACNRYDRAADELEA